MTNQEIYKSLIEIEEKIYYLGHDIEKYSPLWWKLCEMKSELEQLENQALAQSLKMEVNDET